MALAGTFFQEFYPGTFLDKKALPEITGTFGASARAVGESAERALRKFNQRDPQTGAPEGALAVIKDQMIARLALRKRKMHRPILRRSVQVPLSQKSLLLAA